jgi:hypothetical protein
MIVDGVAFNDPGSETFYGTGKQYSGIEAPEPGVDFYHPKNVPHGDARERWNCPKNTQTCRRCFEYTPPDYDTGIKQRYPELYLQHSGEDLNFARTRSRLSFVGMKFDKNYFQS